MNIKDTLIVPKLSKVDMDMRRLKLDEDALKEHYKKEGLDPQHIFESHEIQKRLLNRLKGAFKEATFVSRDDFTKEKAAKACLVISFGGDNHFQYLTHFLGKTPILGINSDPKNSEGALTSYAGENYEELVRELKENKYSTDEWSRLKITLNGKELPFLATNDIFLGEQERYNMSRHVIELGTMKERQKCSGIVIATKAGSTSWYRSITGGNEKSFEKDEARFVVTEPYRGMKTQYKLLKGTLLKGTAMKVYSLNDAHGIICIDSSRIFDFKEGSVAEMTQGEPLKVIRSKE